MTCNEKKKSWNKSVVIFLSAAATEEKWRTKTRVADAAAFFYSSHKQTDRHKFYWSGLLFWPKLTIGMYVTCFLYNFLKNMFFSLWFEAWKKGNTYLHYSGLVDPSRQKSLATISPFPIGQSSHVTREAALIGYRALGLPGTRQLMFWSERHFSTSTDRKG